MHAANLGLPVFGAAAAALASLHRPLLAATDGGRQ